MGSNKTRPGGEVRGGAAPCCEWRGWAAPGRDAWYAVGPPRVGNGGDGLPQEGMRVRGWAAPCWEWRGWAAPGRDAGCAVGLLRGRVGKGVLYCSRNADIGSARLAGTPARRWPPPPRRSGSRLPTRTPSRRPRSPRRACPQRTVRALESARVQGAGRRGRASGRRATPACGHGRSMHRGPREWPVLASVPAPHRT